MLGFPLPTFESAVAKGDGEVCLSLSFWGPIPSPSFSPAKVAFKDGGAGDEDLRVMVGTASEPGSLEGKEISVGGESSVELDGGGVMSTFNVAEVDPDGEPLDDDGSLLEDDAIDLSACGAGGVSNSTGLTRGVAWMLVMSFARLQ
jgi:hypothetical protein